MKTWEVHWWGERLVSRLAGACERIEVTGDDWRLREWRGNAPGTACVRA